jgi:hypothetical protein
MDFNSMDTINNTEYFYDEIESREDFEYRITKLFNQFQNQNMIEHEYRYHHIFLVRDVEEAYANILKFNKMTFLDNMVANEELYEQSLTKLQITENILYKFELEYKDLLEPNLLYFK